MLKKLQQWWVDNTIQNSVAVDSEDRIRRACAVLMVEMQRSDFECSEEEERAIMLLLEQRFSLSKKAATDLLSAANETADQAVSLHEFTRTLNASLSHPEKQQLVLMLWQTAYADGVLHHYEESLVRQVAELLHIPHSEYIQIKHRAELGTN